MPETRKTKRQPDAELAHCMLDVQMKAFNEEARTVDVVMSTPRIDRHGERVELDWDLKAYKRNPVVLWAHDSRSLPIGKAENVRIEGDALVGTIRFCSASANPLAEQCVQLFREGMLNAVSVGFIPHSYRFEKEDDEEVLVLSKNELVELSVTPTPANPDALARRRAKALAERSAAHVRRQLSLGETVIYDPKSGGSVRLDPNGDIHVHPASPGPNPDNVDGPHGPEETNMDLKELQEALAKMTTAKAGSDAQLADAEKSIRTLEKDLAENIARVKALETEKAAFEAQTKTLAAERDAEKAKREAAEALLIAQEVDALVGKKIKPTEKTLFIDLKKTNPDLYTKMVAERSDMQLESQIVPPAATDGTINDLANELKSV